LAITKKRLYSALHTGGVASSVTKSLAELLKERDDEIRTLKEKHEREVSRIMQRSAVRLSTLV